jgi:hypothetical protein
LVGSTRIIASLVLRLVLPPPPSSQGPNASVTAAAAAGMGQGLLPLHGASPGYGTTGPGASSQHGGSNSLGLMPHTTSGPPSSSGIPPDPGSALGPVGLWRGLQHLALPQVF